MRNKNVVLNKLSNLDTKLSLIKSIINGNGDPKLLKPIFEQIEESIEFITSEIEKDNNI